MEGIKDIVSTIVRGCAQGGIVVPDVLAAFVARTVSAVQCRRLTH
jgi:hypothetical protein